MQNTTFLVKLVTLAQCNKAKGWCISFLIKHLILSILNPASFSSMFTCWQSSSSLVFVGTLLHILASYRHLLISRIEWRPLVGKSSRQDCNCLMIPHNVGPDQWQYPSTHRQQDQSQWIYQSWCLVILKQAEDIKLYLITKKKITSSNQLADILTNQVHSASETSLSLVTYIILLWFQDPPSVRANGGSCIPCGLACSMLPSTSGNNVGIFIHCPPWPAVYAECNAAVIGTVVKGSVGLFQRRVWHL